MNSILRYSLAVIITATSVLSSCGKYEEGPKISFASKKSRMVNTWKEEKSIDGSTGIEYPCTSNCEVLELKKDGTYSVNGTSLSGTTWQFSSDKEKLEFVWGSVTTSSIILRLKSNELWLKDVSSNDEVHYVSN